MIWVLLKLEFGNWSQNLEKFESSVGLELNFYYIQCILLFNESQILKSWHWSHITASNFLTNCFIFMYIYHCHTTNILLFLHKFITFLDARMWTTTSRSCWRNGKLPYSLWDRNNKIIFLTSSPPPPPLPQILKYDQHLISYYSQPATGSLWIYRTKWSKGGMPRRKLMTTRKLKKINNESALTFAPPSLIFFLLSPATDTHSLVMAICLLDNIIVYSCTVQLRMLYFVCLNLHSPSLTSPL